MSALLSISVHNSLYYCFLWLDPEIERVTKKIDCTSFELAFKQKTPQLILSLSIRHPPTINWLEWSEKWLFLFSWRKKQRKEEKCASDCWKWLFLLLCLFFFAWSIGAQSLLSRKINQPQEKSPKKQRPFLKEVSFLLIRFKIPFTVRFERN